MSSPATPEEDCPLQLVKTGNAKDDYSFTLCKENLDRVLSKVGQKSLMYFCNSKRNRFADSPLAESVQIFCVLRYDILYEPNNSICPFTSNAFGWYSYFTKDLRICSIPSTEYYNRAFGYTDSSNSSAFWASFPTKKALL